MVTGHAGEHGFNAEGAAALHEHYSVVLPGYMGQGEELSADTLGNLFVVIIPGAVVKQHLLFHSFCCGQRTGCE